MNKRILVITAIVVIASISAVVTYLVFTSRQLSPPQTTAYNYGGLDITVEYFRPFKRGRVIFGDAKDGALQPNGKYWRLGANNATEVSFSKDITFAGQPLKAGSYRMYAVPNDPLWTISLNSELGKWGYDEPNHSLDVLNVQVPVEKQASVTEQFTITFDSDSTGIQMLLAWDNTRIRVPIAVQ